MWFRKKKVEKPLSCGTCTDRHCDDCALAEFAETWSFEAMNESERIARSFRDQLNKYILEAACQRCGGKPYRADVLDVKVAFDRLAKEITKVYF